MTTLGVMKPLVTTIAVVLSLVGCGPSAGSLLTGNPLGGDGCFLATGSGRLVVDPRYGTAIIADADQRTAIPDRPMVAMPDRPTPVAWRPGYTSRRVGSEVEVLDPHGRVVATTGHSYTIPGGFVGPDDNLWPDSPTIAFWACGDPVPVSSVSQATD
jgi:hypothetical protein